MAEWGDILYKPRASICNATVVGLKCQDSGGRQEQEQHYIVELQVVVVVVVVVAPRGTRDSRPRVIK